MGDLDGLAIVCDVEIAGLQVAQTFSFLIADYDVEQNFVRSGLNDRSLLRRRGLSGRQHGA